MPLGRMEVNPIASLTKFATPQSGRFTDGPSLLDIDTNEDETDEEGINCQFKCIIPSLSKMGLRFSLFPMHTARFSKNDKNGLFSWIFLFRAAKRSF